MPRQYINASAMQDYMREAFKEYASRSVEVEGRFVRLVIMYNASSYIKVFVAGDCRWDGYSLEDACDFYNSIW